MKSLNDIIHQATQFLSNSIAPGCHVPPGFKFTHNGQPAHMLVLDASGSMNCPDYPPSRFDAAKQAAVGFLQKCVEQTPNALVGIVFYGESANVAAPLLPVRTQLSRLRTAIERGDLDGSTNISAGLCAAGKQLVASGTELNPTILLLTDGHSNSGRDPVQTAEQLKQAGIRLDIVGIGGSRSQVNERELKQMASVFEGELRYWFIRDTTTLVRKFEALALGKV